MYMPPTVLAFHKPRGLTVEQGTAPNHGEGGRRKTLNDFLCGLIDEHQPEGRLSAVGRLDKDTTGLILLTDDGALNERVLRPGGCSKIYEATIKLRDPMKCDISAALQKMCDGVELADGSARAETATLVSESTEVPTFARLSNGPRNAKRAAKLIEKQARRHAEAMATEVIAANSTPAEAEAEAAASSAMGEADTAGDTAHVPLDTSSAAAAAAAAAAVPLNVAVVRLTMSVGRNRIVRRLLAAVGLPCYELKRVSIGPLLLHGAAADGQHTLGLDEPGAACRLTQAQEEALRAASAIR